MGLWPYSIELLFIHKRIDQIDKILLRALGSSFQ